MTFIGVKKPHGLKNRKMDNFNYPKDNYKQLSWPRNYHNPVLHRHHEQGNHQTDFAHNKNDFPLLQGTSDRKLNQMTAAVLEIKNCLEQFVHHAAPNQLNYNGEHSQHHTMNHQNGYWESNAMEQQHAGYNNQQRTHVETKNFAMPNQGFAQ